MLENQNIKSEQELIEKLGNLEISTLPLDQQKEVLDYLAEKSVEKAREDFYAYVKLMAPVLIPEGFKDGIHIKIICKELQDLEKAIWEPTSKSTKDEEVILKPVLERLKRLRLSGYRDLLLEASRSQKSPLTGLPIDPSPPSHSKRLQIFLPPGAMKSLLASKLFVTWCFGRRPSMRIIQIGHGTQFAEDNFGRPVRSLMDSDEYKAIFPECTLKADVRAAGRFETNQGGTYIAVGVGSNIAGRRANLSIVDDAVSEQTAESKIELAKINNWYEPGLRTRLLPAKSGELIINTRWKVDDLSGNRLKVDAKTKNPWRVVSIPALLDDSTSEMFKNEVAPEVLDILPSLYDRGTSFWPEFQPTDWLLEKKQTLSPSNWASLYMQNPVPEEGNIIKKKDIRVWDKDTPPDIDYVICSFDTAFSTATTADYSACTVWGVFEQLNTTLEGYEVKVKNLVLLESWRGRVEFPELCKKVKDFNKKYKPDTFLVEKKASGQSLIQEVRRWGLPVMEFIPDKDKTSRLIACTPFFQSGRIWVPDRGYAWELVEEVCAFPKAPHDDLTDTVSMTILFLRDYWKLGNENYPNFDEDELDTVPNRRKTYWNNSL